MIMPEKDTPMKKSSPPKVERYKYFWLHTNMTMPGNDPSVPPGLQDNWTVKLGSQAYNDGDHFAGILQEYCIGEDHDLLVIINPLVRVQSDDSDLKWHTVKITTRNTIMRFEACTRIGILGKKRSRFKTELNDLIILSSDVDVDGFKIHSLLHPE
jgi:hypothetical protein